MTVESPPGSGGRGAIGSSVPPIRLLVVCTANICRSVMAGAALRARLPPEVAVGTAGLVADGRPTDPTALAVSTSLGLDVASAPSHRLTRSDLEAADLILGMALHHVRDVVVLDRSAFGRTFALAELVALAEARGGRAAKESLDAWLGRMHDGRTIAGLLAESSPFDVADPSGGPPAAYTETARLLGSLVGDLVRAAALDVDEGGVEGESALGPPFAVEVIADNASSAAVQAVARRLGRVDSSHTVESWREAAAQAQLLAAPAGNLVFCLTVEPHGAAMVANRAPSVRAVVVANPGMVSRARRRLDANVLCVSSGLELDLLAGIAAAVWSTTSFVDDAT